MDTFLLSLYPHTAPKKSASGALISFDDESDEETSAAPRAGAVSSSQQQQQQQEQHMQSAGPLSVEQLPIDIWGPLDGAKSGSSTSSVNPILANLTPILTTTGGRGAVSSLDDLFAPGAGVSANGDVSGKRGVMESSGLASSSSSSSSSSTLMMTAGGADGMASSLNGRGGGGGGGDGGLSSASSRNNNNNNVSPIPLASISSDLDRLFPVRHPVAPLHTDYDESNRGETGVHDDIFAALTPTSAAPSRGDAASGVGNTLFKFG